MRMVFLVRKIDIILLVSVSNMWGLIRPDSIRVFRDDVVQERMKRYVGIRTDVRTAKYLLTKRIPIKVAVSPSSTAKTLEKAHSEGRQAFLNLLHEVDTYDSHLEEVASPSFLDLKVELVNRILKECYCCERRCGVNRLEGNSGVCGVEKSRVSTAFLHQGEEAPLVPSGTIFFSGCTFKCVFCQNWDISTRPNVGSVTDPQMLATLTTDLARKGAMNINYVGGDPTPHAALIIESLLFQQQNIAQLWNSNMYLSNELLELLLDLMDIWLPDFKYGPGECAQQLSKIPNYWKVTTRNIKRVHEFDAHKGDSVLIIRHLVMPNHVDCCTKPILEWIAENTPNAFVNVMGQYRPHHLVVRQEKYKSIARGVSAEEIHQARSLAESLGLAWRQVS